MSYGYYLLVPAFAVVAFLFWKEWKRRNRSRLIFRVLASLLAVLSIVLLAYPDKRAQYLTSIGKTIILTDNFNPDSLSLFLNANKNAILFSTDYSLIQSTPKQKIKWIPDLSEFVAQHADDSMYVFGNGFTKEQLLQLHDHAFVYKAPAAKPTFSSVYWQKELKPGISLTVQGKYDNNSGSEVKLQLLAFGQVFDSATIKPGEQNEFSLSTIPKQTGRAVYSLLALSGKETLQNEPLPIEVEKKSPLKILILSSSPDFEKTFLKNRLAQNGYEIVMSTAISKNKNDEQFLNTERTSTGQFTSSYLENSDVLIADDKALSQLSSAAAYAVRSAVENKGMGLIIKISDEKNASSFYSQTFSSFQLKQDKKSFTTLSSSLNERDKYKLKIDEPLCLRYQNGVQPLLQDEQSNIYAANYMYGQGRIAGITLNNTYTLGLTGNNKAWQSLWSLLIDKTAKKAIPDETWRTGSEFSFINQPTPVVVDADISATPKAIIDNNKISMLQNPILPWQWQGTYWPRKRGWQALIQQDGNWKNWFVYDQQNWKDIRDYTKIKATQQYVADHPPSFLPQTEGENNKLTSYKKLYLVILFFICCGFLWVEQKLA